MVYDLFLLTILTGKGFLGSAWSNTYFVRYYITGLVQSKLAHTIYTQRFLLEVSFSKDNEVFEVSNFFAINLEKNCFHFFLGMGSLLLLLCFGSHCGKECFIFMACKDMGIVGHG